MSGLIDRLRTGTHEQAVGLLFEVQEAVKPEPRLSNQSLREDMLALAKWKDWSHVFNSLLAIGTPEACVGAAMMLIPTDGSMNMLEVSLAWEPSDGAVWPAGIVRWYPPRCDGDNWHVRTETASTAALALAAAIMETRNG